MGELLLILLVVLPFVLTGWNIFAFTQFLVTKKDWKYTKGIEVFALSLGGVYLYFYAAFTDIRFSNWDVPLYDFELHSIIAPDAAPTILFFAVIAALGYLAMRFVPANRQSPVVSALGITAIYLGIGLCVVWCVQTSQDFFLLLYPANCILLLIKTIYILVCRKNALLQSGAISTRFKKLSDLLNTASNLPWVALLFLIPLLGLSVLLLTICGQEPASLIKAWTETADWTLSQRIAPPSLEYDGHYLCTVAAGGHKAVVKPLRTGVRHGHCVLVNRQLCIANAFEQVLEEKTPAFHKAVRTFYDHTGYPISKHIHSKYLADLIYFLMKPLEWLFLAVLYTVDTAPENRIAVQYPHAPVPGLPQ